MATSTSITAQELNRQWKLSGIADWYRGEPWLHEVERLGRDVVVSVDHIHRIIRVESYEIVSRRRIPIEDRMEFDRDVLEVIRRSLYNPSNAIILDTADIPGRMHVGQSIEKGLSARILAIEIDSGEVMDEKTIMKTQPEFPERLRQMLLAVPKLPGESYVVMRTAVAERFVREYLSA